MALKTKRELLEELYRCGKDPLHFINHYAKIQHPVKGLVPFRVYDYQSDTVRAFLNHRLNIVLKGRQLGFTTIAAAFIAWFIVFQQDKNVLILSTKGETAKNTIRIIRNILRYIPEEMMMCRITTDNKQSIELSNGSRVKAITTSADAGRSEAVSLLFVDEVAHIEKMDDVWTGVWPTLSTGGRAILSSTPNGTSNFFYRTYKQAQNYENGFNCRYGTYVNPQDRNEMYNDRFPWWVHPDHDQEWFEAETAGKSSRDIAQEYLCNFNASGDTFLQGVLIQQLQQAVEEPISREFHDHNVWIWRRPERNGVYLICCDVASGFAQDFSTFHVLRVDTKVEQVAEYKGKIPADVLGELLMTISKRYNFATIAPENNSGWSGQAVQKITDAQYPYLYWSARHYGDYVDIYNSMQIAEALPGYRVTTATRMPMLAKMEQYIRNKDIILRSQRLVDEFTQFIWMNGKPQAARSAHDDLIMALCGGLWVREESFMSTYRNVEQAETLLQNMSAVNTPVARLAGFNQSDESIYARKQSSKGQVVLDDGQVIDFPTMLITSG